MNKLEETNLLVNNIVAIKESGRDIDDSIILTDIAKSLAMIANKLCEGEEVKIWLKENEEINNKESIPYLMHKETNIPISECQKAYNIAIEYLRNKATVKCYSESEENDNENES